MYKTMTNHPDKISNEDYRRLKINFTKLLGNSNYCSLCFSFDSELVCLEDKIKIVCQNNEQISLWRILNYIFGDQIHQQITSYHVCFKCKENVIKAYNFIKETKSSFENIEQFINYTNNRLAEIENQFYSEESIEYANTVIFLDDFKENNYIDEDYCIKNYNSETNYICDNCNCNFNDKQTISMHLIFCGNNVNRRNIRYHCSVCASRECKHIKYIKSFREQQSDGKANIQCPDCDYVCGVYKTTFMKHVNKVHLDFTTGICEICAKSFHSKQEYKDHKKTHAETYSCQYCGSSLPNNKELQEHYINCVKTEREHKCIECPASFDQQSILFQHVKTHKINKNCKNCGQVFRKLSSNLKIHKCQNPFRKKKFTCAVCNENFGSHSLRAKHMENEHTSDEKPQCVPCKIVFKNIELYKKHIVSTQHLLKTNPENAKRHKCAQCDYSTSLALALEAHINRYHLKIAPYFCQICNKRFTGSLKLDEHMKTHSKEKKIQCETCGFYLKSKNALKKHLRVHTGEKPYECDVCKNRFTSSSMRNIHKIKKHTKKSIKCPFCEVMFHTLPNMRSHFKLKHWKKKEAFDVTKVQGLKEEHYELFRDRRMIVIEPHKEIQENSTK